MKKEEIVINYKLRKLLLKLENLINKIDLYIVDNKLNEAEKLSDLSTALSKTILNNSNKMNRANIDKMFDVISRLNTTLENLNKKYEKYSIYIKK